MHGVGFQWIERALVAFQLPPVHAVPSQRDPDPTFRCASIKLVIII